jgi:UDP-glucose 4-epimerase
MTTTIVTGGAGYIGSITVEALRARGERVVVIDHLSAGHREALAPDVEFHAIDLRDAAAVDAVFASSGADAVVHFAAFSLVGESVADPAKYFDNNVGGTLTLLRAMKNHGVKCLAFSSTAATYGEPQEIPITESHPTAPANPYGLTKRMMEQVMETYAAAYGLRFAALRYFNAAGAIADRGEDHKPESHLIPLILQVALGQRESISIFGTDYDTPDGTCIRDYIHVSDLADAHLRALDYLRAGGAPVICNLGNGHGYSVREVIDVCRRITGHPIPVVEGPRRSGDPSRLVASAAKAKAVLGWVPQKGAIEDIVRDAWAWHVGHPNGYAARGK